jgi:hypothetical protein
MVVDLFLDIGSLAARAHIDAGGARMSRHFFAAIQYPIGSLLHSMMAARLLGFFGSFKRPAVDVGRFRRDIAQPENVTHAVITFI